MGQFIEWGSAIRDLGVTGILGVLVLVMGYVIRFMYGIITAVSEKKEKCQEKLLEMAKHNGRS